MKNYFTPETDPILFACPCGNCDVKPSQELLDFLNRVRAEAGIPMYVTSGPRCAPYNTHIGGAKYGEHLDGDGADIQATNSRQRFKLLDAAFRCGCKRLGLGISFLHLGVSIINDQDVAWNYP